ncbi:MAG: TIGR02996 domain-containing protein [Kofleriaceae bacterium]
MSTPADVALKAAIAAASPVEMLGHLLASWRAYPAPAVADLIDAASRNALRDRPPTELTGTLADRQAAWMTVRRAEDPLDVPWLVSSVFTARVAMTIQRLEAVAKLPRDPRISGGLIAQLHTPQTLHARGSLWTRVCRVIRDQNDHRVIDQIERLLARFNDRNIEASESQGQLTARLAQTRSILAGRLLPPPPPDPALIAQVAARLDDPDASARTETARTIDDFIADIWAHPKDDGLRDVFADWLIQRDDPRGELIALQVGKTQGRSTKDGEKREKKLLAEHARLWMGPLAPVVKNYVFERGFLARAEINWRALAAQPALMTHPAWATVREYNLAEAGERVCDAFLDHMIALGAKRR